MGLGYATQICSGKRRSCPKQAGFSEVAGLIAFSTWCLGLSILLPGNVPRLPGSPKYSTNFCNVLQIFVVTSWGGGLLGGMIVKCNVSAEGIIATIVQSI